MMKNFLKQFLVYYLPIFLWCIVIFYFSSIPDLKAGTGSVWSEIAIRKAAHLGEYAILLWLFWRLTYYVWNLVPRDAFIAALFFTTLYAGSDEWHQRFVAGRSGQMIDVTFDGLSAILAMQIIIWFTFRNYRKYALSAAAILLLIISGMEYKMTKDGERAGAEKAKRIQSLEVVNSEEEKKIETEAKSDPGIQKEESNLPSTVPTKIKIKVPFTSQAPAGNWDAYHEEACEEASLIMVKYYLDGKKLNSDIAEKEIQSMIKFELDKYGDYKDSTAQQIVELAHDYYGINNLKVVYNFTREDIKRYLAKGKPIIIPAAGRLLGNPNFTAPGPLYHALVLTGYDGDTIITNDPGTRKGENYSYNINVLYNAIHDFPGKPEDIEKGKKAMIIVE